MTKVIIHYGHAQEDGMWLLASGDSGIPVKVLIEELKKRTQTTPLWIFSFACGCEKLFSKLKAAKLSKGLLAGFVITCGDNFGSYQEL